MPYRVRREFGYEKCHRVVGLGVVRPPPAVQLLGREAAGEPGAPRGGREADGEVTGGGAVLGVFSMGRLRAGRIGVRVTQRGRLSPR